MPSKDEYALLLPQGIPKMAKIAWYIEIMQPLSEDLAHCRLPLLHTDSVASANLHGI